MEVIRAKSAGFCFGVKRAVDTVYEQVEKQMGKQIYTYGPIIHNEEVVKDMEAHGVKVLHSEEELKGLEEGLVIIRSHGVPKRICDLMDEKGIEYVDATCPFVKRIHKIVAEESKKGSRIIIIGNPDHPEVEGIRGWAGENVTVIKNAEEAEKFENTTSERICIVSQTTFNYNKFKDLVEIISEKGYDISQVHRDCGLLIFDSQTQDTHSGGSGCGCSASVLAAYILPMIASGTWKRVLFVPTGALLSKTSFNEGDSIPGIAHAVVLEHESNEKKEA